MPRRRQAPIDLSGRRPQLVEMRATEKTRRTRLAAGLRLRLDQHVGWLTWAPAWLWHPSSATGGELDREIGAQLRQSPIWRAEDNLRAGVAGLGPIIRAMLMAKLPELGTPDRRQIASLVGVAPVNRDSGPMRGYRATAGGRAEVCQALYMATVTAIRCNPTTQSFHQHLRERGKPAKVAIIACMRKLLTILNAILCDAARPAAA